KCIVSVDPNSSRLDGSRDAVSFLNIIGPDTCCETIDRLVGLIDSIVRILEGNNRQHGPEDLFTSYRHRVVDIREDCRLHKKPVTSRYMSLLSSERHGGFLRFAAIQVSQDFTVLLF